MHLNRTLIPVLFSLLALGLFGSCDPDGPLEEQVQLLQEELNLTRRTIDSLQTVAPARPGFVHTVFFWFEKGVTEEQRAGFLEGLRWLAEVPTVRAFHMGLPAGTPREVVDNSYDYALILHFADKEGQDVYQQHPIHLAFVENHQAVWSRVQVYDTLVE